MTQFNQAEVFINKVNQHAIFVARASGIHADYVKQAEASGWSRGPRNDEKKTKPNICPFAELSPAVQASNTGPMESVFGYVAEQIKANGFTTTAEIRAFVLGLMDDDRKKVPSLKLGERTWKVWAEHTRPIEPTHKNLVAEYALLDQGTKDYDLGLNATACNYMLELIAKEATN